MIALALDVGHTTGFVVAGIKYRETPNIVLSRTYGLQSLFDPDFFETTMRDIVPMPGVDAIVMEMPVTDRFSADASVTLSTRVAWLEWTNRYRAIYPSAKLIQISAATWKTTPAIMFNVFKMQPSSTRWREYKHTKHEGDASKMLYWLAHYGYDQ